MDELKIIDLVEREDGSATMVVELDEDTKCKLLSIGLKKLLADYLEGERNS
jgi:hypothetical protein